MNTTQSCSLAPSSSTMRWGWNFRGNIGRGTPVQAGATLVIHPLDVAATHPRFLQLSAIDLQIANAAGLTQMICPCDLKRLLLQKSALRTFASRATAVARQAHHPLYSVLDGSSHSKQNSLAHWAAKSIRGSRTFCSMTEGVQAPAAENGAVDAEVEALRKQIADLQVRFANSRLHLPDNQNLASLDDRDNYTLQTTMVDRRKSLAHRT